MWVKILKATMNNEQVTVYKQGFTGSVGETVLKCSIER